jgi:UDP-3-O-[3-hydroxymyristoyl] N-acetylglucosamine deacetylase
VEVRPASAPRGRFFIREGIEIPAVAEFVTDTRRCTTLGHAGCAVSTVEHLLAACMLAELDHADIYVDGPELPALDGSALPWYSAICSAGLMTLDAEIPSIRIARACWIIDGESQFFLMPTEQLALYAALSIPGTIAEQMMVGGGVAEAEVRQQIVRARTFGLEREVRALLASGLALGGSLDNAVVLTDTGYLNDQVWPEEPCWHKVLDLLGDLALTGARISGQILAVRAGHRSHVALARRLRQEHVPC